jgi:protein-disulfide isomerase
MAEEKKKSAAKKSPAKKTATKPAKKVVSKKTMAKKSPVTKAKTTADKASVVKTAKVLPKKSSAMKPKIKLVTNKEISVEMNNHFWLVVLVILFGAIIVGGLVAQTVYKGLPAYIPSVGSTQNINVSRLSGSVQAKFATGQDLIVHGGKTWIPVEGEPVEMIVLTDNTCGAACDHAPVVANLRQGITPALLVKKVDISSKEGEKLIEDFEVKGVPAYFLSNGIEKLMKDGKKFVELDHVKPVLVEKSGIYHLAPGKTGLKFGKFLVAPEFDLEGEPVAGNGPVQVVEFTDYQCPYCKRFYDQNKEVIEQYVADGTITYVIKDFPLGFHAEAPAMHAVGSCVYAEDGIEAFNKYKDAIFANQGEWSGKTGQEAVFAGKYAKAAGSSVDAAACIADTDVAAEVSGDMQEGGSFGVSGTPSVFIGTQIMPGAIGAEAFKAAVEAELKK